jgi:hypothetical protein
VLIVMWTVEDTLYIYIYIYKRVPDALALAWTARLARQVWHCGLIVFLKN